MNISKNDYSKIKEKKEGILSELSENGSKLDKIVKK